MQNDSEILVPEDVWSRTCNELQQLIPEDAYQRWFAPLRYIGFDMGTLTLGVENAIYQYWIEENYLPQLRECASLVTGRDVDIAFESVTPDGTPTADLEKAESSQGYSSSTPSAGSSEPKAATESQAAPVTGATTDVGDLTLIPRYLFSSYVVGVNNQFAHAAAMAVAESPARTYNPLFIHGSVGLGKTHLMHAIGHKIMTKRKNARIVYVTSEQFTNEFVSAIQHGQLAQFRRRFRKADALLIDDVQFFGGKDRSQEEFFHTFNALFDGNKQIVLSSDAPPSEASNMEQRLISRFEWGLTAELQPPDIETRLAILRAKADKMQVRLGDSVLMFIAERIKANIRRLEGALNRVAAWASLNDRKITEDQVEELLKDFIQQEARTTVTIDMIQRRVAEDFDIRLTDMSSKRRPNNIATPRMVAMYLSRRMTSKSLQEIGEAFGGRDHGTVLHACKTIERKMANDDQLRNMVTLSTKKLEGN